MNISNIHEFNWPSDEFDVIWRHVSYFNDYIIFRFKANTTVFVKVTFYRIFDESGNHIGIRDLMPTRKYALSGYLIARPSPKSRKSERIAPNVEVNYLYFP